MPPILTSPTNLLWIIENFTNGSDYTDLATEVKNQGFDLLEIKRDFKRTMIEGVKNRPVIFQGSIEMTAMISNELLNQGCYHVKYCSIDNYRCSHYYSYFGAHLFNDNYALMSLSELYRQHYHVWGNYGKEALIFIRPDRGDKPFQAQLLDIIDLKRFMDRNDDIKHQLVLASTPKKINSEFRFVVTKNKEILGYSLYSYQGQLSKVPTAPIGAVNKCREILDVGYYPDDVFVVDICEDAAGDFWLLELNSFSSAGLYECNKKKIVEVVSKMAVDSFNKNDYTIGQL